MSSIMPPPHSLVVQRQDMRWYAGEAPNIPDDHQFCEKCGNRMVVSRTEAGYDGSTGEQRYAFTLRCSRRRWGGHDQYELWPLADDERPPITLYGQLYTEVRKMTA